jgi:fructose-bisphosphate aldolase/2-amino-3,7-dideoxy-D-threo-hept-6-ulosonate synthase
LRLDSGKKRRLKRIFSDNGKTVIIPFDDGLIDGPFGGLKLIGKKIKQINQSDPNGVLGFKGLLGRFSEDIPTNVAMIVNLTASTTLGQHTNKQLVCTVEEAIALGAEAVAVHVNIGSVYESRMLKIIGEVSRECTKYGMPLMALMYPRGRNVTQDNLVRSIRHATRVGAELGADIVKTFFTGDTESFYEVVSGCPVPVVMAGGAVTDLNEFLGTVEMAMEAGAAGVVCGRNVFNRENSDQVVKAITARVHGIKIDYDASDILHRDMPATINIRNN